MGAYYASRSSTPKSQGRWAGLIRWLNPFAHDVPIQELQRPVSPLVPAEPIPLPPSELESLGLAQPDLDGAATKRALDELFSLTEQYSSSKAYDELLKFIVKFRSYAPFNAMLVHIQMPGARYVAPPSRWLRDYRRRIKAGGRALVILQPMGPVLFVFDVSDTVPEPGAPSLPKQIDQPFEVRHGHVGKQLEQTIENSKLDGVLVVARKAGSQSAGCIGQTKNVGEQKVLLRSRPHEEYVHVSIRYELMLNSEHSREAQYATLAHELAHLYCGHLGTPNPEWWPDRRGLDHATVEFEAESVCYLVCQRLGIDNPSETYLANFVKDNARVPTISLDSVMTASGLIERMGRERLKPRKQGKRKKVSETGP